MTELLTTLASLVIGLEDTVHRADGTEGRALIPKFRVGFIGSLVGKPLAEKDIQNRLSFVVTGLDRFMLAYSQFDLSDRWGKPRSAVVAQGFIVSKR